MVLYRKETAYGKEWTVRWARLSNIDSFALFFLVNLSPSVCRDIQMKGISPWSFSIVHTTERYKTIMELGIES